MMRLDLFDQLHANRLILLRQLHKHILRRQINAGKILRQTRHFQRGRNRIFTATNHTEQDAIRTLIWQHEKLFLVLDNELNHHRGRTHHGDKLEHVKQVAALLELQFAHHVRETVHGVLVIVELDEHGRNRFGDTVFGECRHQHLCRFIFLQITLHHQIVVLVNLKFVLIHLVEYDLVNQLFLVRLVSIHRALLPFVWRLSFLFKLNLNHRIAEITAHLIFCGSITGQSRSPFTSIFLLEQIIVASKTATQCTVAFSGGDAFTATALA
mmetsp:Transcript_18196/g.28800  ORF Transcript_18196/g.28800 Transcript_18196/m.28800 type:complete len:268 (+) Transcript_18196:729-1532(+)